MDILTPWIESRITEILGNEDEILLQFIVSLLEEPVSTYFFILNINFAIEKLNTTLFYHHFA